MPELTGTVVPSSGLEALPYPGRIIKLGEKDKDIVKAVQQRLNESGCGPLQGLGDFCPKTEQSVKLFQARFTDTDGASRCTVFVAASRSIFCSSSIRAAGIARRRA